MLMDNKNRQIMKTKTSTKNIQTLVILSQTLLSMRNIKLQPILMGLILSIFLISSPSVKAQTVSKQLYLTDALGLDRIDPVATTDNTTSTSAIITSIGGNQTYLDQFTVASYSNSNGTLDWSTSPWVETDVSGGGATGGSVLITGGVLSLSASADLDQIYRPADLAGANSATVSYVFTHTFTANPHGTVVVEVYDGSTWRTLETLNSANPSNSSSFALNAGELNANFQLRFRSTAGNAGKSATFDDVQIAAIYSGSSSATFTQGTALCSDLTLPIGETVTVTNHIGVTSGSMIASPNISATLQYGATTILALSNPTYDGVAGTLTWTATMGSTITVPAAQSIELVILSSQSGVGFEIYYDSQTYPSKVELPTTTYISVDALAVYDATYAGGSIIITDDVTNVVYIRAEVSDPFGTTDITDVDLVITDPGSGTSNITLDASKVVATVGCSKTYEYTWTIPSSHIGTYTIEATANEGTEGVTDVSSINFEVTSPSELTVTKTLTSPASGPYTIDDILTYTIEIENTGSVNITSIPLEDTFYNTCLEFVSTNTPQSSISGGTIAWNDLGSLTPTSKHTLTVTFKVIDNCDPARNIALVDQATDTYSLTVTSSSSTIDINIDEPPVANNDTISINATTDIVVLSNDTDPDGDIITVTINAQPPAGKGTVSVNGDNSIRFTPDGAQVEDETVSFSYQVCDAASTPYCDIATVYVLYSTVNNPPSLTNDVASTTLDLPVIIDVLDNDSDTDGSLDLSSLSITADPTFGIATINGDGTITYQPNPSYEGTDQFTYRICDDGFPLPAECATATVDITTIYANYVCTSGTSDLDVAVIPGALNYSWDLPAGAVITAGANTNTITVDWSSVTPGEYDVCALGLNDCGDGTELCEKVVVTTISPSKVTTDIACLGDPSGEIDLTVSGGVPDYTYAWSNGASIEDLSGLSAGTYNVTVSDKYGCFESISATITQPASSMSIS
ncbi:MAG: hypothetical protein GQ527_12570, partial [Bacteroidales bacterium]|nr:hypothetical protein [Bacteroidales bacterium]